MFNNIKAHTYSDKKWNEDVFAVGNSYLLVIDGATGLGKNNVMGVGDDAMWFAHLMKEEISNRINENISLSDIVTKAIEKVQSAYAMDIDEVEKIDMPSGCIALFRERDDNIEFFGLGDTCGVIEFNDGSIEVISDKNLEQLDQTVIEKMQLLSKEQAIPFLDTRKLVNDDLIQNRKKRNTKDGYYALDLTLDSIPHAINRIWKKSEIKRIACMSDGFYQIMGYSIYSSLADLLDSIQKEEINVFDRLKEEQENDRDCIIVPRFKLRDDMTMAYAEVE